MFIAMMDLSDLIFLTIFLIIIMQIIIAVVIQNTAALFQYTQPFPVCPFRMLQIPCEISRNDHIKGFIFKR